MFTEMGWLDDSYNFDNVTAEADVLSLPAAVSSDHTVFWSYCNYLYYLCQLGVRQPDVGGHRHVHHGEHDHDDRGPRHPAGQPRETI